MIKFVNKNDGAVFYAEDGSILYAVLINDKNYEIVREEKTEDIDTEYDDTEVDEASEVETVEAVEGTPEAEEKPKRGAKKVGA